MEDTHMEDVSFDSKFVETSEAILSQFGYKDLKAFIKKHASMLLLAKIEKYESEMKHFEDKYRTEFDAFSTKVAQVEDHEDFEMEDDLSDWRFASEALARLRRQKQELENA
jgi:hypothetical protein